MNWDWKVIPSVPFRAVFYRKISIKFLSSLSLFFWSGFTSYDSPIPGPITVEHTSYDTHGDSHAYLPPSPSLSPGYVSTKYGAPTAGMLISLNLMLPLLKLCTFSYHCQIFKRDWTICVGVWGGNGLEVHKKWIKY